MNKARIPVARVNALDREAFVRLLGPVFEHSPWIAEAAWPQRPFTKRLLLLGALCAAVEDADEARQLALIRAHPDLVGRAALAGSLTPESAREQAGAGLDRLSAEEVAQFQEFNRRYREKFGFPFVICARRNKKEAILAAFPARLAHGPEEERRAALMEIFKIASLRLEDLVEP
jgi:OHCU decarboxylase